MLSCVRGRVTIGSVKEKVYYREVTLAWVIFPGWLAHFSMGQLRSGILSLLLPCLITVLVLNQDIA